MSYDENRISDLIDGGHEALSQSDFERAVEPAIRYLLKNHHPHTKIYIDYSGAELLEGKRCHNLNDEVPD